MTIEVEDLHAAGQLLQFGLRPKARPQTDAAYATLVSRYVDRREFRTAVQEIAQGLGLRVLQAGERGVVLVPLPDSVFGMDWQDLSAHPYGDERLVRGLIHVAIMATVFPRARDLEEDPSFARPPVTVNGVEQMLRTLCTRLEEATRSEPDPPAGDELAGLYEAWRVYHKQPAAGESTRRAVRPTRTLIAEALGFLHEHGCFLRARGEGGSDPYQPTWRYQVMVQDSSAAALHHALHARLDLKAKGLTANATTDPEES